MPALAQLLVEFCRTEVDPTDELPPVSDSAESDLDYRPGAIRKNSELVDWQS